MEELAVHHPNYTPPESHIVSISFAIAVRPAPRETVPSYVARLAASKGVTALDFCVDMGVSLKRVINHEPEALACLEKWGELDSNELYELMSWTGVSRGDVRMELRGEVFGSRALRNPLVRGCSRCLVEDAVNQSDEPLSEMVMRGEWQLRDAGICLRHKRPLVELWTVKRSDSRFDISSRLDEIRE